MGMAAELPNVSGTYGPNFAPIPQRVPDFPVYLQLSWPQNNIRVIPPLLRKEVTLHEPYSGDYIHGYMVNAGFSENVMKWSESASALPSDGNISLREENLLKDTSSSVKALRLPEILI